MVETKNRKYDFRDHNRTTYRNSRDGKKGDRCIEREREKGQRNLKHIKNEIERETKNKNRV